MNRLGDRWSPYRHCAAEIDPTVRWASLPESLIAAAVPVCVTPLPMKSYSPVLLFFGATSTSANASLMSFSNASCCAGDNFESRS